MKNFFIFAIFVSSLFSKYSLSAAADDLDIERRQARNVVSEVALDVTKVMSVVAVGAGVIMAMQALTDYKVDIKRKLGLYYGEGFSNNRREKYFIMNNRLPSLLADSAIAMFNEYMRWQLFSPDAGNLEGNNIVSDIGNFVYQSIYSPLCKWMGF